MPLPYLLIVGTGLDQHATQFSTIPASHVVGLLSWTWELASGRGTRGPSPVRVVNNHMETEELLHRAGDKPSSPLAPRACWRPGVREKLWLQHLRPFRSMCVDHVLHVWVRMHHGKQSGASPRPGCCGGGVRYGRTLGRGARLT